MVDRARWVVASVDALEITEPAVSVGHSFGGGVAIRTAADVPDRIATLVVSSIGGAEEAVGGVA